mgnify:CR=1 FL=1
MPTTWTTATTSWSLATYTWSDFSIAYELSLVNTQIALSDIDMVIQEVLNKPMVNINVA